MARRAPIEVGVEDRGGEARGRRFDLDQNKASISALLEGQIFASKIKRALAQV